MRESIDYQAICCSEPMRNMGLWPVTGTLAATKLEADGSTIIDFDTIGEENSVVYANRYHCLKCNRYIGIAWHQEPRIEA